MSFMKSHRLKMKTNVQTGIIIGTSAVIALAILITQGSIPILKYDKPIISQNDLYCVTVWKVRFNTPVDHATLETILRDEIAELGTLYDMPEREIQIDDIGNNRVKITIQGLWLQGPNAPDLGAAIASIDSVEEIEHFVGGTEAWCQ